MTIIVSEKPHAVLGPSGWHTWGFCSGAPVMSEGLPRSSSKYADEGTAAHAVLEECIADRKDAEFLIGEEVIVEGEVWTVDQEMADAVNSSIDIVYSYKKPDDLLQVEQTVPLAFMTGEEGAEGTCDVALLTENGTHLHVFDFKYGKGVQVYASEKHELFTDADDNVPQSICDPAGAVALALCKRCNRGEIELEQGCHPNGQLAMYALGWLEKHGFLYEDVTKVTLHVLQPRLEHHDEFTLPIEALRGFEDVVREAAGRVEMNRQAHLEGAMIDLRPSEKSCKFCRAKAHCPALRNQVSTSLKSVASDTSEFDDLTLPKQAARVAINEGVSSEKLAEFMRAVPLLEEAITAARAEVERRLFAGQQVPGFYLGEGRKGNRAWQNEDEAEKLLKRWLKVDGAYERKLISPAKAEKALKAEPKKWAKLQPIIGQADGKPSVCKEGDKNAVYVPSKVESFQNLDAIEDQTVTVTKVYDARTGNGTIVETSDGGNHVFMHGTQLKIGDVFAAEVVAEPDLASIMD